MEPSVGTFNLNNLFSRFNFRARVEEVPEEKRDVTVTFEFTEDGDYWFRTFRGRLIQPMSTEQARTLAGRISRRFPKEVRLNARTRGAGDRPHDALRP